VRRTVVTIKMNRRQFLKVFGQVAAGYALGGTGLFQYGKHVEAQHLSIERVQIPIENLKPALEGLKIVHMSDIHLHPFTQIGFVRKAVALANSLQPDIIALTGDYVTSKAESILELAPALASLRSRYGVFASLGNHEIWTNPTLIQAALEQAGLTVLVNEGVSLHIDGATLYLAGLDDLWDGKPDLDAALVGSPPGAPVVLLAHEPDFADDITLDGRVSLQLSGHSHGGQVRLPGFGAFILAPHSEKYDQGLYNVDGMWVYTTRGIGLGGVSCRVNCPPEVTEITLLSAEK
jgi:predicted MPP superfamily phosphohydrolase